MYQMIVEIVKIGMSSVVSLYQSFMFVFLNKEIVSAIMMVLLPYFVLCLRIRVEDIYTKETASNIGTGIMQ